MPDLAELTLVIKSEQAAKAAQDLGTLERASAGAEQSAQKTTRAFEQQERAAVGLERAYDRARTELQTLTAAQLAQDRAAQHALVSVNNLGAAVSQATERFDRFGVVDLEPLRNELAVAEENLNRLEQEALAVEAGVGELNQATLEELSGEVLATRDAFDQLEARAGNASSRLQEEAASIIRAYNLAGRSLSESFEAGVELTTTERIQKVEAEANRRRELTSTIAAQLSELGRLGTEEQAEIVRANDLTNRFEEQSRARLLDADAARVQAEASRPRFSQQFEGGVDLTTVERIAGVEAEASRRYALITAMETQLATSGRLGPEQINEIARSRELTGRFEEQSRARIQDQDASARQAAANTALNSTYGQLLGQVRGLILAYGAFVSVRGATSAILEFGETQSSLRGVVEETTRGLDDQSDAFARLDAEAKQIGLTSEFNASVTQGAFRTMIESGKGAEDSILSVRAAMDLTEAQGIPLGASVDLTSRALQQLGLDGSFASRVLDSLVNVAIRTQADIQTLAFGFNQVGPAARAAGVELDEVVATLGVLSQLRGRGQQAPLVFKEFVEGLIKPSKEARQALTELGIPLEELNPRTQGLVAVLERLRAANLSNAQTARIFGQGVSFSIPFLISQTDKIKELVTAQEQGVGVTNRLARANSDNLKNSLEDAEAAIQTFLGSSQGLAGGLRDVVDAGTDVIRILGGVEEETTKGSDGARAFADGLKLITSPLGLVTIGVTGLAGAIQLYTIRAAAANTVSLGFFGTLAAHPFLAIGGALGVLITSLYLFRERTFSAREEMEKLGESFDFEAVDRMTDAVDRLTAAYGRARGTQEIGRQAEAVRGIRDELGAEVSRQRELQQAPGGADVRIPLNDNAGLDLRATLARLESQLELEIPVELRLEEAIDQDAQEVRNKVAASLLEGIKQARGEVRVNLREDFFPVVTQGIGVESRESVLRRFIPAGTFEIQEIEPQKVAQFLGSMEQIAARAKAALVDGLSVDESKVLEGLSRAAADELLKGEQLITISASRAERVLSNFDTELSARQKALDSKEGERTRLAQEANTGTAELTESQSDARKELEQFVLSKREELALLQATAGLVGEAGQRYGELAQFQRLAASAGLEVSESQSAFNKDTERLVGLLQEGFSDPAKLAAFREELGALLLQIEEFKRAQGSFKEPSASAGLGGGGGSSGSGAGLEDATTARILSADAILGQEDAVQRFIKTLRQEREDLQKSLGLTEADAEAVLNLSRAERLLADTSSLSTGARQEYLQLAEEEIQRLRQAQQEKEALARSRGEERRALDDAISARLEELDAYASGRRGIQEFLETLANERQERERTIGLTEDEAGALQKLMQLERLLANTVGLTAEEREGATEAARAELRALLELSRAKQASQSEQEKRAVTREEAVQSVRGLEEENLQLQDSLDLLDARTESEREYILQAAARRALRPYEEDLSSLEELLERQDDAIAGNRRLRQELLARQNERTNLQQGVSGLEKERVGLGDDTDLLNAKGEAERRALTLARLGRLERFTANELEKKSLEELRRLYLQLSEAVDKASKARDIRAAQKELDEEIRFRKLPAEDQQIEERLRALPIDEREANRDSIRDRVQELNRIQEFEQIGRQLSRTFTDAFEAIVFEGAKLPDIMGGIARRILSAFTEVFINKPLENLFANLFSNLGSSLFGAATGGGTSGGGPNVPPKHEARGDVFGYRRGAAFAFGDEPGLAESIPPTVRAFGLGEQFTFERPFGGSVAPSIGTQAIEDAKYPHRAAQRFARGNPFLNSVVSRPTLAPLALFGEAGPEAIMPLERARGGLGVAAFDRTGGVGVVAPLRRGSGGRLGIDLDKLLDQARAEPKVAAREEQRLRRLEVGGVLSMRTEVEPFALGGVADVWRTLRTEVEPFTLGSAFDDHRTLRTEAVPFAAGAAFAATRLQPIDLRSLFPTGPAGSAQGVPQPYAVVPPSNTTDASTTETVQVTIGGSSYHFHGVAKPDDGFNRARRHHEQDLRDKARSIFSKRNR